MVVPSGPWTLPTIAPRPTPMEMRNRTGSKKPETITSQLVLRVAISPRAMTALALREYSGPNLRLRACSVTLREEPPEASPPVPRVPPENVLTGPSLAQNGAGSGPSPELPALPGRQRGGP